MDYNTMIITKALTENPELFWQEAARRSLLFFVQYMRRNYDVTPFHSSLIKILDRFAKGQIRKLIIQCPPQHGKALRIDTPVLTTEGWKSHGELRAGDYVYNPDGRPVKVLANSGQYEWPIMRVGFADGFELYAAPEHEWELYVDRDNKRGRVCEIMESQEIFKKRNRRAPYIKATAVLKNAEKELPIDPYLLGVWLGDGNSANAYITCGEEDIAEMGRLGKVTKDKTAYRILPPGLQVRLRKAGLLKNKHIPIEYLLASERQRRELLKGLMDTDGTVNKDRGMCEFCQKDRKLVWDVYSLLRTLGYKPTAHRYASKLYGKDCGYKIRLCFVASKGDELFNLPRKQERVNQKTTADRADKDRFFITSTAPAGKAQVNCIEVEGGLYLAGRELVVTHNSELSSRLLPAYLLGLNPDLKVCICSYAATIATDFNRDVQRIIDTDEYRAVFPDSYLNGSNVVTVSTNYLRNSNVFEMVGHQGSLRVVGRGGSLTSKTVDVMIMDDLYKDALEANSPVVRQGAWDWYTKVARTRTHNQSQELIVFTRWHPEDIIGKVIDSERVVEAKCWDDIDNAGNAWVLINFEAIKTGLPTELDTREQGQALWPARHSLEKLLSQKALDPVGYECLYQGNPGNAEGKLYTGFKTWVDKSDYGTYVRSGCYIDVADEGDDFLCSITYDIYRSEQQAWNEQRKRFEPLIFALITDIIYTDENADITAVTVPLQINANKTQKAWIESNNGGSQYGKIVRKKVKANCVLFYQGANKESRIVTAAPFVNQQIIMPIGWENRYPKAYAHVTGFLRSFPANAHDDIEDTLTGIYEKEIADGNARPYVFQSAGVIVH